MAERISVVLSEREQAHRAIKIVWEAAKKNLADGRSMVLELRGDNRRDNHNRHFHSLISQISKHVGGDLADVDDAKRVLISAFRIDTKDMPEFKNDWERFGEVRMGKGIYGEVVVLGVQSRQFTIKMAVAFIEWLYAFGSDAGVSFKPWDSRPARTVKAHK